jgi:hypothetical protein
VRLVYQRRKLLPISLILATALARPVAPRASADSGKAGVIVNHPTLNLGNVISGQSSEASATLTNTASASVTVEPPRVSGTEFEVVSPRFPLILAGGQHAVFTVAFTPTTAGPAKATVTFPIAGSNAKIALAVYATAVTAGKISLSLASIRFGNVAPGRNLTKMEVFTNSGGSAITVKKVTMTGDRFRLSAPPLPFTLAVGQRADCRVTFAPGNTGSVSGSISLTTSPADDIDEHRIRSSGGLPPHYSEDQNQIIDVSGTGFDPGTLGATTSLTFPNVAQGANQIKTVTLTNAGAVSITVNRANLDGRDL